MMVQMQPQLPERIVIDMRQQNKVILESMSFNVIAMCINTTYGEEPFIVWAVIC